MFLIDWAVPERTVPEIQWVFAIVTGDKNVEHAVRIGFYTDFDKVGFLAAFRQPVYIAAFAVALIVMLLLTDWPSKIGNRIRAERLKQRRRSLGIGG